MTTIYVYGQEEIDYLSAADPVLGAAIRAVGKVERKVTPDPFVALVDSIVSQLISNKAAEAIWNRLIAKFGELTPEKLAAAAPEEVKSCGTTMKKAEAIVELARKITAGELGVERLQEMEDEQVVDYLMALKGVGRWTAEMVLIFSLQRPDVVSWGDVAIRRGVMKLHGLESLTKERFDELTKPYSPHGTVASLYLWAIAHLPEAAFRPEAMGE
ncbi:DNA-3-methyladenine glycosylase family protein [Cohnella fermenti]|uniref:DNA-3-methyladenine glycosylase II n=1 Tax=Cohnella fermenti TaxID=2565925 RepID=A0A4S4BJ03_9BACL|nr:DNA-3-methyladenine glycosylase [Cohnella fermenti]THF74617.1 DNA-3-methyladenine glycosylase 2 family protein [Cohnella fermenti]